MNIPTAEQFLENYRFKAGEHIGNSDYDLMAKYAIDFAKLHVESALKTAQKEAQITDTIGFQSILNAYPLDNIK